MFQIIFLSILVVFHIFIYFVIFRYITEIPIISHILKLLVALNFILAILYTRIIRLENIQPIIYTILSSSIGIFWIFFNMAIVSLIILISIRIFGGAFYLYKFIKPISIVILLLSILLIIFSFYINNKAPIIKEEIVQINGLKKDLRVVLAADLHINTLVNKEIAREMVNKINDLNPDLVILPGDIVDTTSISAKDAVNELKNIQTKYGVYYSLGNHEYLYDLENIIELLKKQNINVLINNSIFIESIGLNIAGTADMSSLRYKNFINENRVISITKTFENINANYPVLLLSHQPKVISALKDQKVNLVVSGHTHGGQIFPFNFLVLLDQPFLSGLNSFQSKIDSKIYVTTGVGWWGMPMRLFRKREIVLLNLVNK